MAYVPSLENIYHWGTSYGVLVGEGEEAKPNTDQVSFQCNLNAGRITSSEADHIQCPSRTQFISFDLISLAENELYSTGFGNISERKKIAALLYEYRENILNATERLNALGNYRPNRFSLGFNNEKRSGRLEFNVVFTFVKTDDEDAAKFKLRKAERRFLPNGNASHKEVDRPFYLNHLAEVVLDFHIPVSPIIPSVSRRNLPTAKLREVLSQVDATMELALTPAGLAKRAREFDNRLHELFDAFAPGAAAAPPALAFGGAAGAEPGSGYGLNC